MSAYDPKRTFRLDPQATFLAAVAASKATYILSLHESSAVGIAAGYALITGKPSVVSLHTYPGLANGMFNMRNALMAGVPLLVINGQQDSRFLIHNPVLGAPNVELAKTATKYSYEVTRIDDVAVALQRCYLQARLQPTGPVFLSIPMNFMLERTPHTMFKKTRIIEDVVPRAIEDVARALKAVPPKKLIIVADYAVWPRCAEPNRDCARCRYLCCALPRTGHGRSAAPKFSRSASSDHEGDSRHSQSRDGCFTSRSVNV
jgi:benzoylformate decarboxylase